MNLCEQWESEESENVPKYSTCYSLRVGKSMGNVVSNERDKTYKKTSHYGCSQIWFPT